MYVYLLLKNKISTLKILWLRVTQYVIGSMRGLLKLLPGSKTHHVLLRIIAQNNSGGLT